MGGGRPVLDGAERRVRGPAQPSKKQFGLLVLDIVASSKTGNSTKPADSGSFALVDQTKGD